MIIKKGRSKINEIALCYFYQYSNWEIIEREKKRIFKNHIKECNSHPLHTIGMRIFTIGYGFNIRLEMDIVWKYSIYLAKQFIRENHVR